EGGYLWAPDASLGGQQFFFHKNLQSLRIGDVVVHYANGSIRAPGCGVSAALPQPDPEADEAAKRAGYLARTRYFDLERPIGLEEIPGRTPEAGPFAKGGGVQQGYLYELSGEFGDELRQTFEDRWPMGSPWAESDSLHLLFKWSADREPRTIKLHR